ncbi:HNH endonuclease [Nonomuraea basaltis]|nr:HNH endonuclease [Nonomuraea basaltis]
MPYGPTSARTVPLPKGWGVIRKRILKRDGFVCTWIDGGMRCSVPATDVDHIGDPADHSEANLRSLCQPHHRRRSSAQGGRAAQAKKIPRKRRQEAHPGLL